MPTNETIHILEKKGPGNQALSIAGGEPTVRKAVAPILAKAKELNSKPHFFNYNALLFSGLEDIPHYMGSLIIVPDSLDREKRSIIHRKKHSFSEDIANY